MYKNVENQNFSGAKAPLCPIWDTGRVAPFVVSVSHRQNIFRSVTQRQNVFRTATH